VYVSVKTLCRSPGHVRGVQGWHGCRFCRRGGFRPPGAASPRPHQEPRGRGIGARLSMTKAVGGCKGVVPMHWRHPDRARTALSPISSRSRPLSAGPPPAPATPASSHERGGGIGARLMHRIRAELQGKRHGRKRGVQGHALLMCGGGWYERPGCVRLLAVTSRYT
jgi:hypothetical protein